MAFTNASTAASSCSAGTTRFTRPREAIAAGKELFYRQSELGIEAAYQLAGQTMACNMMLDVAQEGVQAFIDKRAPAWRQTLA